MGGRLIRIYLAEVMGWTKIRYDEEAGLIGQPPGENVSWEVPNPVDSEPCCSDLRDWLLDHGCRIDVDHYPDKTRVRVWRGRVACYVCSLDADPHERHSTRLRRAYVDAAWQAVQEMTQEECD